MAKRLLLEAADGRIAIMEVVAGEGNREKALASFSASKWTPVNITEVDLSEIPSDRSYRNAWVVKDGIIDHDMDRAKELHKDKLRNDRAPLLAKLDLEISKALSQGRNQDVVRLEAERQRLRDVTAKPEIAAATSVEDLKKITIDE